MHHFDIGLFVLPVAVALIGIGGAYNAWRLRSVWRALGRKEVEAGLARLGETAVSIEEIPLSGLPARTGLGAAVAFRIVARAADGAEVRHQWAYEPALLFRRPRGLKQLASNGIWIALA
ncbi:hypothetical protein [Phenylobacterium sp.]|jgi:hypothetical protein|uniref:hypothetical protein n=1 Tax=Phenylobacterium sp. TaxID=1871053 RepID=UPI002F416CCC